MRSIGLIFIFGTLLGCGSEQPTGDLSACSGQVSVTEDLPDIIWSGMQNLGPGTRVGQYVRFEKGIIANEMMLRTVTTNAPPIKINIYKGRLTDTMGAENPPLKELTVTRGLSSDANFEMWLQFPEPFEFQATSDAEEAGGLFYFITIEPVGGMLSFYLSNRDTISRVRKGIRWATNSDPPWHPTDTSKSLGVGFRGESKCLSPK